MKLTGADIELRVMKSVGSGSGQESDVTTSYGDWQLRLDTSTTDFQYPQYLNVGFTNSGYKKATCTKKFLVKEGTHAGSETTVKKSQIQFTVSDNNSCQHSFGQVQCNITINGGNNLKWANDFQPKVVFSPF